MYNRYISSQGEDYFQPMAEFEAPAFEEPAANFNGQEQGQGKSGGFFNNIRNMFGGNKGETGEGGLTFDMDTIFMLALVYFLIMDDKKDEAEGKNENMMETLLIIAALFLFGF